MKVTKNQFMVIGIKQFQKICLVLKEITDQGTYNA